MWYALPAVQKDGLLLRHVPDEYHSGQLEATSMDVEFDLELEAVRENGAALVFCIRPDVLDPQDVEDDYSFARQNQLAMLAVRTAPSLLLFATESFHEIVRNQDDVTPHKAVRDRGPQRLPPLRARLFVGRRG